MASHGVRDRVAIVGMGCTNFTENWGKGLDDLIIDASNAAYASAGVAQGRRRRLLVRHRPVGHERHHPRPPPPAAEQARHPRRELLRHRLRGPAPGVLRGGVGGLRPGHGRRRREGQGHRLPGPQRLPGPERRHRPHAHRGGHVLDDRPRLRPQVRRRRRRPCARCSPTSPARTTSTGRATSGPSSARRSRSTRSRRRPKMAGTLGVFDCAGVADGAAARHRVPGRGRPSLHRPAGVREGAVVRGRQRLGPHRSVLRLHDLPRDRGLRRRRLPAGRREGRPGRGRHGRGPRLLHAHRARADGGPPVLRAGHGVARRPRRRVRPRRRAPGEPRRRAEELRSPGRRQSACG